MHVDAMAAALINRPASFDTVVLPNMFGDILTDEAAEIIGSLGLAGSASLGEGSFGLYEPIHGSSPDIAGRDRANPVGMMLSGALMLRHSLDMPEEATAIEQAIGTVLDKGYVTADLYAKATPKQQTELKLHEVGTMEFSLRVLDALASLC
jgi:3-isopropylmalate dehydrogenase